jgi:DNA polymerase-3 subunit alpha
MFDLFGDQVATPMPALELEEAPVPRAEELAWEKELLGVYVSEHPFKAAASVLAPYVTAVCAELALDVSGASASGGQPAAANGEAAVAEAAAPLPPQGREATIAGMVGNTRRLYTRDGRPFCAAEIEDLSGTIEVTVWPELFERTQDLWIEGNILLMQVRVRERSGRLQIAVQQVELYQASDGGRIDFRPPDWLAKEQATLRQGSGQAGSKEQEELEAGSSKLEDRGSKLEPDAQESRTPDEVHGPWPLAPDPSSTDPPVATATRQSVRIELRETEDEAADRERLQRLLVALRAFPGDDEVRLTVHTLDGRSQTVALPSARACEELAARLSEVLAGAGEVSVRTNETGA